MKVYILIQILAHGEVEILDVYDTEKAAHWRRTVLENLTSQKRYLIISRDFWKENEL